MSGITEFIPKNTSSPSPAKSSSAPSLLSMNDIKKHEPNESLYLVGNGHIIRGKDRIHLIGGYAGVGKSRAANYLAYCGATGERWFDYEIQSRFNTLFLQTENGLTRLKYDFEGHLEQLDGKVFFGDLPDGIKFTDEGFCNWVRDTVIENNIGMIVIDPFSNLTPDTTHKDYIKIIDQVLGSLPDNPAQCPAVMIVAHLRKPASGSQRKRGAELMHEFAGSQLLTARSRFVLTIERADPTNPEDDRIIATCAKANDALEMPRGCYKRGRVIFEPAEETESDEASCGIKRGAPPRYKSADLLNLVEEGEELRTEEWLRRATTSFGISGSQFHNLRKDLISQLKITIVRHGIYRRPEPQ